MKKLITALLSMIIVAPMLMATQCSQAPHLAFYLVEVENKSDIAVDSLRIGYFVRNLNEDTIAMNWSAYKIDTPTNQQQGYITELYYSYDDEYCFEIKDKDYQIVADTTLMLEPLPEQGDHVRVILVLEKTGELHIDKVPIKR